MVFSNDFSENYLNKSHMNILKFRDTWLQNAYLYTQQLLRVPSVEALLP